MKRLRFRNNPLNAKCNSDSNADNKQPNYVVNLPRNEKGTFTDFGTDNNIFENSQAFLCPKRLQSILKLIWMKVKKNISLGVQINKTSMNTS